MRGDAVSGPQFFKKNPFVLITFLFCVAILSFVSAEVTFDSDVAGVTPDKWYYFFDFTHTPQEALAEAGLMAEVGDADSTKKALENFADEVEKQKDNVEEISVGDVNIETLSSDPQINMLYESQADLSNYKLYLETITSTLVENSEEEYSVIQESIAPAEESIADVGAVVEERTVEAIEVASENSGVPQIEVDFAIEEGFSEVAGEKYPEYSPEFDSIANIQDIQELKVKIFQLRQEIVSLEVAGEAREELDAARNLLRMAESHGVDCLHADEADLGITAEIHINAAEDFLENAEGLLNGEIEISELSEELEHSETLTAEEIKTEIEEQQQEAEVFAENYEILQEKYAEDPVKLAVLEAENERLEKVEELGNNLYEGGVMEKWESELVAEGLSSEEIKEEIGQRFNEEWNYIKGEDYVPAGLYVLPGDENIISEVEGEDLEVVPIGRVDVVEKINPETGEVTKEFVGWNEGEEVSDLKAGGGFAIGSTYTDPVSGEIYTFGEMGYSVVTPAGMIYEQDYPTDYAPTNTYESGDESFSYQTENGDIVTYSTVGYEIKDSESEETLTEESYSSDFIVFSGGETSDNDATGYFFSNGEGEATVYVYNPETESFSDTLAGKVFVPQTPSQHSEFTSYNSATGSYEYSYAGGIWSTDGSGTWTSPTGQQYSYNTVPAPVGYESLGTWTTPSGKEWTYDSETNSWMDSTTGASYTPAPNNYYRPTQEGYFTDYKGSTLAPVGTEAVVNGERYVVTGQGWTKDGVAVAPPYDSSTGTQYPNSATGFAGGLGNSGSDSGYRSPWGYNSISKQWVSGETGDKYDPSTGTITHPDGTVYSPQGESSNEGSGGCYGCYYSYGGSTNSVEAPKSYTYDLGYYQANPVGGYDYVSKAGEVQYNGDSSAKSADGTKWSLQGDTWVGTKTDGTTITGSEYASQQAAMYAAGGGQYYSGGAVGGQGASYPGYSSAGSGAYGGGYDSSGKYVGGSYGGYDSSGSYVGTGGYYGGYYSAPAGGYTAEMDSAAQSAGYADAASAAAAYSSGSYSGGYAGSGPTGGSYSGDSGDSGGSAPSGGDSGSSGGSTGGDSGGTTGAVVANVDNFANEDEKTGSEDTWISRILKKYMNE